MAHSGLIGWLLLLAFSPVLLNSQTLCDGQQAVVVEDGVCNPNGYALVFEDNFDGQELDLTRWAASGGVVRDENRENSQHWFTDKNIEVSGGTLKLVAGEEQSFDTCFDIWVNGNSRMERFCYNFSYTSAEIQSRETFTHGMFEMRCRIPKGKGLYPAFWLFSPHNEIDVFEFRNEYNAFGKFDADKLSRVHIMTTHYDYDGDGKEEYCPLKYKGPDFSESFHTFTLIWTPHEIRWLVDGELKRRSPLFYTTTGVPLSCADIKAWNEYILDRTFPRKPMKIIATLGIQNGDDSPDQETKFPAALEIDYIRYYRQVP